MSGRFITMMFGLCGAALAIYHTAKPENIKKVVGGLMLSAALTSFLTGITEPLEFSFLFVAPILYVIHAFFDGLAFMWQTFSTLQLVKPSVEALSISLNFLVCYKVIVKTNYLYVIPIGIVWFCLYYIVSRFLITKFNFKTPGREDKEPAAQQVEATERAQTIVAGLGGKDNIESSTVVSARLRYASHFIKMTKSIKYYSKVLVPRCNPARHWCASNLWASRYSYQK